MKRCYYISLENKQIKLARNILKKKSKESYQVIKHMLITLIWLGNTPKYQQKRMSSEIDPNAHRNQHKESIPKPVGVKMIFAINL